MFQEGPSVSSSTVKQSKNARNKWMHYYMEDCVGGDWVWVKVMEPVTSLECEVSSFCLFLLWHLPSLCLFSTFSPCPGSNFKLQQPVYSPAPRWLSFLSSLLSSWPGSSPPSFCVSLHHFPLSSRISPYSTSFHFFIFPFSLCCIPFFIYSHIPAGTTHSSNLTNSFTFESQHMPSLV